jgi:carbon monoxide dehydrogenase subunit G
MTSWRQIRPAWAAAGAAALVLHAGGRVGAEGRFPMSSPASAAPSVSVVSMDRGAYRIDGSFRIQTTAPVAWSVLTDYDNIPSFVSSMRSSAAARDESGRLFIAQRATGRAGPFSRTLHVVLEVAERPTSRIEFRDISGTSFGSYVGSWSIDPDGAALRVTYVLEARPHSVPRVFARSILASNARGLLDQVRQEMLRRSRAAPAR